MTAWIWIGNIHEWTASAKQYETLMLSLADRLHAGGKLLTAAVLSGATADGNIYYDAAAHTNAVLNAVDFINVMAYDGGDGERHSSYDFAVACGTYWKDTRGLPAHKIVLGVPFYARPSWADYRTILMPYRPLTVRIMFPIMAWRSITTEWIPSPERPHMPRKIWAVL